MYLIHHLQNNQYQRHIGYLFRHHQQILVAVPFEKWTHNTWWVCERDSGLPCLFLDHFTVVTRRATHVFIEKFGQRPFSSCLCLKFGEKKEGRREEKTVVGDVDDNDYDDEDDVDEDDDDGDEDHSVSHRFN